MRSETLTSRNLARLAGTLLTAAILAGAIPGALLTSPHGSSPAPLNHAAATAFGTQATTTEFVNTSGSGTGILIQEFSVPDSDSELDLDIELTTQDLDQNEDGGLRTTDDSDTTHHILTTVLRDGAIGLSSDGSSTGGVGGVYVTAAGAEAGAGVDGLGHVKTISWKSTGSAGEDLQLVVIYVRSKVTLETEITWTGEVGTVGDTTHGPGSVVSHGVDDFPTGVGVNARPGPSVALEATSTLQADDLLGYFNPSQGPGVANYRYQGPEGQGRDGTVAGLEEDLFFLNGDEPGSWRFHLQAVYADETDLRPVLLAGDLDGRIGGSE